MRQKIPEKRKKDRLDYIDKHGMKKCSNCLGNGRIMKVVEYKDGRGFIEYLSCNFCYGIGKLSWTEGIIKGLK